MSDIIRQLMISGRVQGVGYRAWLAHTAQARGLHGWVRNRRDGSVEAVLAGVAPTVTQMIEMCWRGPTSARVDNVLVEEAGHDALALREAGERFSILPTV